MRYLRLLEKFNKEHAPLLFFLGFFLLNGLLGYLALRNIEADQGLASNALRHISLINEMHLEVLRAESAQRGYLLTELDSYAAPYQDALDELSQAMALLLQTSLAPEQTERLERLQVLLTEKRAEMDSIVQAVRNNQETQAIQQLFTHRGRDLMAAISSLASEMRNHERESLALYQDNTERSRVNALYIILTANLLGLVMVFVAYRLLRNSQVKEKQHIESLRAANDNLESKVAERTEEIARYSNELKRSNRELQDFAFVASHDLQEPLRKIRAFGDRLQSSCGEQLDAQGLDYLARMQKASARMSRLIEDLLSFSRITTKSQPFQRIELDAVLEEVQEDLELAIEESAARISSEPLPEIEADPSQMKQLFQNLVGNALKFRKDDQAPEIRLSVKMFTESADQDIYDDFAEILVEDNGIGFDAQFAERIFTPFQRLHGRDQYSGTGIGLAICRRIVERHGGSIRAQASPGQGACFVIRLPLRNQSLDLDATGDA